MQRLVLGALVVVADQVQEAVDDQPGDPVVQADALGRGLAPGRVHRDEDVAQFGLGQHGPGLVLHRKGEHVGRPLFFAVLLVVGGHFGIVQEDHAHLGPGQVEQLEQAGAVAPEHLQVEVMGGNGRARAQVQGHAHSSLPAGAGVRRLPDCCS